MRVSLSGERLRSEGEGIWCSPLPLCPPEIGYRYLCQWCKIGDCWQGLDALVSPSDRPECLNLVRRFSAFLGIVALPAVVPAEWLVRRARWRWTADTLRQSRRTSRAGSSGQGFNQPCQAGNFLPELLDFLGWDSCGGRGRVREVSDSGRSYSYHFVGQFGELGEVHRTFGRRKDYPDVRG